MIEKGSLTGMPADRAEPGSDLAVGQRVVLGQETLRQFRGREALVLEQAADRESVRVWIFETEEVFWIKSSRATPLPRPETGRPGREGCGSFGRARRDGMGEVEPEWGPRDEAVTYTDRRTAHDAKKAAQEYEGRRARVVVVRSAQCEAVSAPVFEPTCECGHVRDEHDLSGGSNGRDCQVDGCDCINFTRDPDPGARS